MAAMKREFEDKINQDLENKQEEKDLLLDQFKKRSFSSCLFSRS